MLRTSSFDVYKNVKNLLNSSGDNVTYFCDLIKHLSKDKSKKFVLNSSDSIFNEIKLPENVVLTDKDDLFSIALSLLKVSRSAYLPKNHKEDSKSSILPKLLDCSLNKIRKNSLNLSDINTITKELKRTAQFISDNTLQDNYGQLRPFVIDRLRDYQSILLDPKKRNDPDWLECSLSLFDLMKTHSIDSKKLNNKILEKVENDPGLINSLSVNNLYYLYNMDLSPRIREYYDNYMKSIYNKDFNTLTKHMKIIFEKYDKSTIEGFMSAMIYKLRHEKCDKELLLEMLRNLRTLNDRHNDPDLGHLTSRMLEILYPKITQAFLGTSNQSYSHDNLNSRTENVDHSNFTNGNIKNTGVSTNGSNSEMSTSTNNKIGTSSVVNKDTNVNHNNMFNVNRDQLTFIFETYSTLLNNPSSEQQQFLSNFILQNKDIFTPIDLVSIIDCMNRNRNVSDGSKVLMNNEYVVMSQISNELTKYLLNELEKLEFNDLCEILYSFPLLKQFQFYNILCSYSVNSNKMFLSRKEENFKEKLMEIVRRRILYNLENNDKKSNLLYSKYIVNTMLHKDYDLNNYFKHNMDDITSKLSTNQLVRTLTTGNFNQFNQEALNKVLNTVTNKLDTVNKMSDIKSLIEKNRYMKDVELNNKLFSILTYNSINDKNGYTNILLSIPHLHYESDRLTIDTVLQYLNRYMFHLSVYDVESLLNCMKKHNIFNNKILELLNHTYDVNTSNTSNKVLTDLLCHLKDMRIRHEPVIRKLTDRLLSNFRNFNSYHIRDLISLTDSLSELSIPYNDLYMYLNNYLSTNVNYLNECSNSNSRDNLNVTESNNISNFGVAGSNFTNNNEDSREFVNKTHSNTSNTNRFSSLNLRDKIELLYSISNLGIVDNNLKTLYVSVINQLYPDNGNIEQVYKPKGEFSDSVGNKVTLDTTNTECTTNTESNSSSVDHSNFTNGNISTNTNTTVVSTNGSNTRNNSGNTNIVQENDLLLKLYEIHLEFILNNIYNQEGDVISKKLETASKVWFTGQELKSQKFKKSDTYATIKNSLKSLNVKFESGVTEIYFCNFVIREGDKPTVIYVVPNEDILRFWTTSLDPNSLIENPDLSVGNSQKIIKNLKLSGYNVVELLQSKWDSHPSERTSYLKSQLNLS